MFLFPEICLYASKANCFNISSVCHKRGVGRFHDRDDEWGLLLDLTDRVLLCFFHNEIVMAVRKYNPCVA